MTPESAAAWLPVIRDYAALCVGIGLGIYFTITRETALATTFFGLAGFGALGRAAEALRKGSTLPKQFQRKREASNGV